jgi:hypothetical protein
MSVSLPWGKHSGLHGGAEVGADVIRRSPEADNAGPMPISSFVRYLLLPARPTVLFLIAALSLGFLLALHGGLLGIVLALLLLTWLFN